MSEFRASFSEFFDENFGSVCRGLTVALGDAARAEEAAQEAFVRAYLRWNRVSEMSRPAGWVYVTAVRYARRHHRPELAVDVVPGSVADASDQFADREQLRTALAGLPERQRLAVVLRYGLDLSLEDIAAAMGCALGTVKSTLHSGLARLQVTLEDSPEEVDEDASR